MSLEDLAEKIRTILNASTTNRLTKGPQRRYGENLGGEYFLIECFGLEIHLISNKGGVEIEGYSEYEYYLMVSFVKKIGIPINNISSTLCKILMEEGIAVLNEKEE